MEKIIFCLISNLVFTTNLPAQSERYTKGAENGYAWIAMEEPQLPNNDNKYKYLAAILEKENLVKNNFHGSEQLLCKSEKIKLLQNGGSDNFSLDNVVKEIDDFYSNKNNLEIPVVFAYCYVIKEVSGLNIEELAAYKRKVLQFCSE